MNAAGTISATATKGDSHTAVEGVPRRSIARATTTLATAMPAGHVDAWIPVLARMHAKRLAVWAALGFDIPKSGHRARPDTGVGSTSAAEARG